LRTDEEAEHQRHQKEDGGVLVFDTQAGKQSEKQPCAGASRAIGQPQERQQRAHPEAGLEGVHGKVVGCAEKNRSSDNGGHGQHLRGAAAAKLPCEQACEANRYATCQKAEDANAGRRKSKERLGQTRLHGHQRRHIHVAPGQVMAADQEVKLVAEEAVAQMAAPQRTDQMDQKGERGKEAGEQQGCVQRGSRGDGRRDLRQEVGLLDGV
jgi:hypothetical protein